VGSNAISRKEQALEQFQGNRQLIPDKLMHRSNEAGDRRREEGLKTYAEGKGCLRKREALLKFGSQLLFSKSALNIPRYVVRVIVVKI
jgi:hypothetical protein